MITREDRIKGVLAGQAAGDALGAPYEYRTPPKPGTAEFGPATFGFDAGSWTDDTEQAFIVANAKSEVYAVAQGLIKWWESGPTDVGSRTTAALSGVKTPNALTLQSKEVGRRWSGRHADGSSTHSGESVSNGSLMRTGPVCLPFLGNKTAIVSAAGQISDLTHYDPDAREACIIWSLLINDAIQDGDKFSLDFSLDNAVTLLPHSRQELWQSRIMRARVSHPRHFSHNGPAVRAFQAALSAVFRAEGLEDGLQRVVAIGGDTDTVAAVAGALLGAIYGASAVPQAWRKVIHGWPGLVLEDLEELALDAAKVDPTGFGKEES